jgi:glycerophosphoryl diester phosphodiesterase
MLGALALGVHSLEMDLAMSRDGALVVHHDPRLHPDLARDPAGRWIDPPGPLLRELDLDALRRFDVGRLRPASPTAARFPEQRPVDGARIPQLAEVLRAVEQVGGGQVRYDLEIKSSPLSPAETAAIESVVDGLVAEVRDRGLEDRTRVRSFDFRVLERVRGAAPELQLAGLTSEHGELNTVEGKGQAPSPWTGRHVRDFGGSVAKLVRDAGCSVWAPNGCDLTAARLREAHEAGLSVIPYTTNEPSVMEMWIDAAVDGITTDYPDRLCEVLAARGLAVPPRFDGTSRHRAE